MTDLTEVLRDVANNTLVQQAGCDALILEAATTLENLTQENARMREALEGLLVRVADDEEYGPDHAITIARKALGGDHD